MAAAMSAQAKLAIGSAIPVDQPLDYQDEDFGMEELFLDANGNRGTRSRHISRNRASLQAVVGPVNLKPNAVEWSYLLPWILGAAPSGNTYALAETLPARNVVIDRVTNVFTYAGVKVDRAVLRAEQGGELMCNLELVGTTEVKGTAGTFPALSINTTTEPFILSDLVITVGGTTTAVKNFELTINNMLDRDRFFNSNTIASVETKDREVTLAVNVPFGDHTAFYVAGNDNGLAVSATFTNGNTSMAVTLPAWAPTRRKPGSPARAEIMLTLSGKCFETDASKECVFTLDSTP